MRAVHDIQLLDAKGENSRIDAARACRVLSWPVPTR